MKEKDTKLIEWTTEIKGRADCKAGEILASIERSQGKCNDLTSPHGGGKSFN